MGKQKGEAARSKARPSSSSLAASLLPSGGAAVGFGGYVGKSRLDSGEDAIANTDIDSEVTQHLKRLARKDPTTKLKALTSLSSLVSQKAGKDIISMIPQWAFEYKKLLLDYNREVRRATHDTMTSIVSTVGRDLAPHLKILMGPWWFSQFDSVSEVSQAAKRSLQVAFPSPEKRLDAIKLCATEIFMYLEENLKFTPQSMSDKELALDELQEMHQKVISSSLLALATLLDVLMDVQSEKPDSGKLASEPKHASKARVTATSYGEKLFSNNKYFLEFLKSSSAVIRSSAYSVLRSYIKNIPHLFNEENMKAIASSILGSFQEKDPFCYSSIWDVFLLFTKRFPESWNLLNVHKVILNRLWHYLRSGCFGSHHVAYPALVIFLDTVPPKAISGEQFFLDFFQNLWAGKNSSISVNRDRHLFFQSFKECFLWALNNGLRFVKEDALDHFRAVLVDNILVKLLWNDYMTSGSAKVLDRFVSSEKGTSTCYNQYPVSYAQDLGICIIEILSGIHSSDNDLFCTFSMTYQENCLDIFQQKRDPEHVARVNNFSLLMKQHAVQQGEIWPLVGLIGPTLGKFFSLLQSTESPDAISMLSVAVSVFGPRNIVKQLIDHNKDIFSTCNDGGNGSNEMNRHNFMHAFTDVFVPWCLHENKITVSSQLDLLLALLDDEYFHEQWSAVISYIIKKESSGPLPGSIESNKMGLLDMLLNKSREKIRKSKNVDSFQVYQSSIENWHNEFLDSVALSIASSLPPYRDIDVQFVRDAFGVSAENKSSFLSRDVIARIFHEISQKLLSFVMQSSCSWIRDTTILLTARVNCHLNHAPCISLHEMAQFALCLLDGNLPMLILVEKSDLIVVILASLLICAWESDVLKASNEVANEVSENDYKARTHFGESVSGFIKKIDKQFLKDLTKDSRKILGSILMQFIRAAIVKEHKVNPDKIVSLCCQWTCYVLEHLPVDQYEEQSLLDQLLNKDDTWPMWSTLALSTGDGEELLIEQEREEHRLIAVVDKLISRIGVDKVLGGYSMLPESSQLANSRQWLAVEVLCTWKWQGGSVIGSFIPSLVSYAKESYTTSMETLLDCTLTMLLDGALAHGTSNELDFSNIWPITTNEVESIREPYLRGMVSLLLALFGEKLWKKDKAMKLFRIFTNKLLIGEEANMGCLRILPLLMCALIHPLHWNYAELDDLSGDTKLTCCENELFPETIRDWLQRALSFRPLTEGTPEQDMIYWFQLVVSCYPMNSKGGVEGLKTERNVRSDEEKLLYALFRKQRISVGSISATKLLPPVQMILSKLLVVSVGYCWKLFDEEDWEFVLYLLRCWIESAVVMMEDMAEKVDEILTNSFSADQEISLKTLEPAVSDLKPFSMYIGRNALYAFTMFRSLLGRQTRENAESLNLLKSERWDQTVDRVVEGIFRLFFSSAVAESIASSCSHEASSVIATSRINYHQFWELVSCSVRQSSIHARHKAIKSVELWGLSVGPISSLYAILFSTNPTPSLQLAAFFILSLEPVSHMAIIKSSSFNSQTNDTVEDEPEVDPSTEVVCLRDEISAMIKSVPNEIFDSDLVAQQRVNVFLAWSLLLSHLSSLPSSSPSRERLVQFIHDSADSTILDCLFQHIPLELCMTHVLKKKDTPIPNELSQAVTAATQAIRTGSLLFSVESLWPVEPLSVTSLAGALFGLMLRALPAYVREWYGSLRDRSRSSSIELFTRTWCSPPLVADEISQIKQSSFADENFSVSVSKSSNEIVATYKTEETGMDLVIRLPASYPLKPVDVDCIGSLGISEVLQRKWLLSMVSFVRNQNGALAEAISIWKKNFDKEFEGIEECPICYSIIHTANHSLPRLACRTCKHKFHSACLYKWFSTSHKSTCPLCQSPF
ncbi:unnamed protein product [Rhodiola kirilowii]